MDILLIDGRDQFRTLLSAHLRRSGHRVRAFAHVGDALALLESRRPDAVMVEREALLRQGQPLVVAAAQHSDPPVIVFAPQALEGSDLAQVAERMDRVEALRQEVEQAAETLPARLQIGELVIDHAKRRAIFRRRLLPLTPTQYRLLYCLACHAGQVVSYRELLRHVWGFEAGEMEARDLLKAHVRQIRRKMGPDVQRSEYLKSVRGFGYMLVDPREEEGQQLPAE